MFDTHCHLNFQAFDKNLDAVVKEARETGVRHIVVPSTDLASSKKAVEIAKRFDDVYAAVGIHPHHIYKFQISPLDKLRVMVSKVEPSNSKFQINDEIKKIEKLLQNPKVVAVGEIGVDRYYYRKTKYTDYQVTGEFIDLQKKILRQQIELAVKYKKSLILHNREAKQDLLKVLGEVGGFGELERRVVFHCCEPEEELLTFAKEKGIFIGVDGDVTYNRKKQEFVKRIPKDMLVLETDSPFLIPEPLRSQNIFPNTPKNLTIIAEYLSQHLRVSLQELTNTTTKNAKALFRIL
ncbi:TatD family hydrolase [Candidatus Roizmanbacteria bacterium]|nr:TatD family hydrolase [Candidatus Roizmanbacteria bacterium]